MKRRLIVITGVVLGAIVVLLTAVWLTVRPRPAEAPAGKEQEAVLKTQPADLSDIETGIEELDANFDTDLQALDMELEGLD